MAVLGSNTLLRLRDMRDYCPKLMMQPGGYKSCSGHGHSLQFLKMNRLAFSLFHCCLTRKNQLRHICFILNKINL